VKRVRTPELRVVLYPGGFHSRTLMHAVASVVGLFFVFRMATGGPAWMALAWYVGTFALFHAAMVPFMTVWHAVVDRAQRYLDRFAEEDALRADLTAYRNRLRRAFPVTADPPTDD
jgi:hypothetical protein